MNKNRLFGKTQLERKLTMIVIRQTANEVVDSKRISELFPFDKEFDHRTKCGNNLPFLTSKQFATLRKFGKLNRQYLKKNSRQFEGHLIHFFWLFIHPFSDQKYVTPHERIAQ